MISLLLTLFISMFSIGSSINRLDDHIENNITIPDTKPINKLDVIDDNNYVYYSINYFCSDDYLNYLYSQSSSGATIYPYDDTFTTMSSVFNGSGSYLHVNYNSSGAYPIKFGYFYNNNFVLSSAYNLLSIDFHRSGLNHENNYVYVLKFNLNDGFYFQYLFYRYNNTGLISVTPICNFTTNFYADVIAVPNNSSYVLNPGVDRVSLFLPFNYFDNYDTYEDYQSGYYFGYDDGYANGKTDGYDEGLQQGELNGYQTGYDYAMEVVGGNATALTIFTGIIDIALVPVNVFLGFMNFDILGINVAGFVSGLITASMIVIVLRFIFGGKKND